MRSIEAVHRSGVAIAPDGTIRAAAELMDQAGVGALVVIDSEESMIGIVTDRDLVRRGIARGVGADARIDSVMTSPVVTVAADADLRSAYPAFRTHGLRRLAVERDGRFVGMITIDDLLVDLASQLNDLARPVTAEIMFAHREPSVPVPVPH